MTEADKISPTDGEANDTFGREIESDSGIMLVSASSDSQFGLNSGSVYVFQEQMDGAWLEVHNITPDDLQPFDFFGGSLLFQDNTAFISSSGAAGIAPGNVYVYQMITPMQWLQLDKFTSNEALPVDGFGVSLARSGDLLAVGAFGREDLGIASGAAYIFRRDVSGNWIQEAKLLPDDGEASDNFGSAIAIQGDICIIGAPATFDQTQSGLGTVYVFQQTTPGDWIQQAKLTDLNGDPTDQFGDSISFDGDYLAIGAWKDVENQTTGSGSVSIFHQVAPDNWILEEKLTPVAPAIDERFGKDIHLQGEWLIVGATGSEMSGAKAGAVSMFKRQSPGIWSHVSTMTISNSTIFDSLGQDVDISGTQVIAGNIGDTQNGSGSGAVFVFDAQRIFCPTDLNDDATIDTADLGLLIGAFGSTCACCPADINGDGTVDTADLGLLIGAFGSVCP